MIHKIFLDLNLLDGEKIRVVKSFDAIIVQEFRPSMYDEPAEWTNIYSQAYTPSGLRVCVDRALFYAWTDQKALGPEAYELVC
jgi:hypothetical protein